MIDEYREFIAGKALRAPASGLEDVPPLGDYLAPFQKASVTWALRRGRGALLFGVGLGKTRMQLAFAEQASAYLEAIGELSDVLILTPLAVAAQTVREGEVIGIDCKYCKSADDMVPGRITVTNYDRFDNFDSRRFGVIVLDESSILKFQAGKTRTKIIESFKNTPFRLACTATPAPNDRKELGNHAEFLGVMSFQEMLSEFFVHDSGKTQQWRLKGHAEKAFWRWVASWGAMVTRPSDLGFDDTGYILPPIRQFDHTIGASMVQDRIVHAESKQLNLLPMPARSLKAQNKARRVTLEERVKAVVDVVLAEPHEQWSVWCELNKESEELISAIAKSIPGAVEVKGSTPTQKKEDAVLGFASGSIPVIVTKSGIAGFGVNWQGCARMVTTGMSHSFEKKHQTIGRHHRFGQKREVHVHDVFSELEGDIVANQRRKAREFAEMADKMRVMVKEFVMGNVLGLNRETTPYEPTVPMAVPGWLVSEVA